jgi:hypothetical protein
LVAGVVKVRVWVAGVRGLEFWLWCLVLWMEVMDRWWW